MATVRGKTLLLGNKFIFFINYRFVMKTDDDIFLNVPLLRKALKEESKKFSSSIVGCIKNDPRSAPQPIPSMDNPSVDWTPRPALPPFAAGAGYVLPGGATAALLYTTSLDTKLFPVEDVYTTAMVAARAGLDSPEHDARFTCGEAVAADCHLKTRFTGHRMDPQRMHEAYQALTSGKCL